MVIKRNTSAPIANRSLSRRIASRCIRNKEAATSSVVARGLSLNLQVAFGGGEHTRSQVKLCRAESRRVRHSWTNLNWTRVSCLEQQTAPSIAYRTFSSRSLLCWRSWRFAIVICFANEPRPPPCPARTRMCTHILSLSFSLPTFEDYVYANKKIWKEREHHRDGMHNDNKNYNDNNSSKERERERWVN